MKNIMFLKEIAKLFIVVLIATSCHKKEQMIKAGKQEDALKTSKKDETKTTPWRPYYSWLKTNDGC